MATISGNLSLNNLDLSGQLSITDLYASGGSSGSYYYIGYPGDSAYDKNALCINDNYIKQISKELHKAMSVEKEIVNEPEIPEWTGFIEL